MKEFEGEAPHATASQQLDELLALDYAEVELLSKQAMNALFNERDANDEVWQRYPATYRHYIHDGGLITIFAAALPDRSRDEGIGLPDLIRGAEFMHTYAPEFRFEFVNVHASSKPMSAQDKRRRPTFIDVFITFDATGLPTGTGGIGMCVFKWARRQEQWVCLKSTSLASSVAYP